MRKPASGIRENKAADQLPGNLCFRYSESTIALLPKFEISSLQPSCDCTAWFVSDLVGKPEDWFSHNEAQIMWVIPNPYLGCQLSRYCAKWLSTNNLIQLLTDDTSDFTVDRDN